MARVHRVGVVGEVAHLAGRERPLRPLVQAVDVTLDARGRDVRPGEFERGVAVLERRWRPRHGVVAVGAGRDEARHRMHGVRHRGAVGAVVVLLVAAEAVRRLAAVDTIRVALHAVEGLVPAGQRELALGVIERRGPVRGVVAEHAIGAELARRVRRRGGRVVLVQMAPHALVAEGRLEVRVLVTLVAGGVCVRPREREAGGVVIETRGRPEGDAVTLGAVLREVVLQVVRRLGGQVVLPVAAHAVGRAGDELQVALFGRGMAGGAVRRQVGAFQREAGQLMRAGHPAAVDEAAGRVAAHAIGAELPAMRILVAGSTGGRGALEVQRLMAGTAGRRRVGADQRKAELVVVERPADRDLGPPFGPVAGDAVELQLTVR